MKKILIVDDELGIGELLMDIISSSGIEADLRICRTCSDALVALREKIPFDLVITDFSIPHGHEGALITQAAKDLNADIPVIVMSGMMEVSRQEIHELCNANEYVAKPFTDFDALTDMIKNLLGLSVPA
jgi:DNA-binding NtrC family response regulator